jgi:hypothetical protein
LSGISNSYDVHQAILVARFEDDRDAPVEADRSLVELDSFTTFSTVRSDCEPIAMVFETPQVV